MRNYSITIAAALFALAIAAPQHAAPQQEAAKAGTVRVQIHYTGKGTVDETHRIYIALWDSPHFVDPDSHIVPIAAQSITSKDGTVTFSDVTKNPVYASCLYDPTGKWDAQSPPPDNASVGLYANAAMQPSPIQIVPGKTADAQITFDDSIKLK